MKKSILLWTKTTYVATFILFLLCLTFSCQQQVEEGITEEEVLNLVEGELEIYNEGNLALADELIAPDYVEHTDDDSEDIVGIDAFKEDVTILRTDFPDFKFTIEEIFVKDNKIVERWIATGTSAETTDKKIRVSGISILHVVNGKFVERWTHYNEATVLRQLGFTFTPPQPPAPQEK